MLILVKKVDNCKYEEKQIIAMSINMTKEQSCHEKKQKNQADI